MKVCFTVNSSPWSKFKGGGQIAVHNLACALKKKGCGVHVLYSKGPEEFPQPDVPYKIHWTRHYDFATVNLNIFSFARALEYLAEKEKFDIIHGNAEEAFFADRISRQTGAKFVFTSHAPSIPKTGMIAGMLHPIRFLKSVNTYLLRSAASRAERVITFSRFSKDQVVGGLGNAWEDKVDVVTPGIDPTWFDVQWNPPEGFELLFWGRVEAEKGLPELFLAVNNLSAKFQRIRLTVIGEGSKLGDYQRQVEEMCLTKHVSFSGWQCIGVIQKEASTASVAVFPSLVESFGLSVVEAQAAGVPVIATSAGAIPENITDGETGRLVTPGNAEALTRAITDLLENPMHYQEMAANARARASGKFSWDKAAERTIEIYQQVLGEG